MDIIGDGWEAKILNGNPDFLRCDYNGTQTAGATTDIAVSTWYSAACTSNGTTLRGYINGVQELSSAISGNIAETTHMIVGMEKTGSNPFAGRIDEVRVEATPRDPMDLLSTYRNVNATTTYYTVGAQEGKRSIVRLR